MWLVVFVGGDREPARVADEFAGTVGCLANRPDLHQNFKADEDRIQVCKVAWSRIVKDRPNAVLIKRQVRLRDPGGKVGGDGDYRLYVPRKWTFLEPK